MASGGQYFKARPFLMFPPVLRWLIGANVVVFLVGYLTMNQGADTLLPVELMRQYGALWPIDSPMFRPWQYVTSMFLHGGTTHVFFNMLALWMFGVELANMWGPKRFVGYYLLSGIGGGILHGIITYAMGDPRPAIGASGAVMGVIAAFGLLLPKRIVMLFPLPPMPARYAAALFLVLEILMGVFNTSDGVAHFAHAGGIVAGVVVLLVARARGRRSGTATLADLVAQQQPDAPPQGVGGLRVVDVRVRENAVPLHPRHVLPSLEFGDEQPTIDRLLDKAARSGYNSLSDEEKQLLIEASKRLR